MVQIDEFQNYYVKGKKPDTKRYLISTAIYVEFEYEKNKSILLEITTISRDYKNVQGNFLEW